MYLAWAGFRWWLIEEHQCNRYIYWLDQQPIQPIRASLFLWFSGFQLFCALRFEIQLIITRTAPFYLCNYVPQHHKASNISQNPYFPSLAFNKEQLLLGESRGAIHGAEENNSLCEMLPFTVQGAEDVHSTVMAVGSQWINMRKSFFSCDKATS